MLVSLQNRDHNMSVGWLYFKRIFKQLIYMHGCCFFLSETGFFDTQEKHVHSVIKQTVKQINTLEISKKGTVWKLKFC